MIDFSAMTSTALGLTFVVCGLLVLVCGIRLTHAADLFADRSGLGEAVTGAVFIGAMTSLAGSVTSTTAAARGHPELALANAFGGIAAQTAFLVLADLTYRRANLEHAAASLPNIANGVILMLMLTLVAMAAVAPDVHFLSIHPVTPVLFLVYGLGARFVSQARSSPMWRPQRTTETREDEPSSTDSKDSSHWRPLAEILVLGGVTGVTGYIIAESALEIAARTGIREGMLGLLLTSVITSTPELVTTIAAVRRGALTLAVGGIFGGNAFDVLFAAFSDIAYRPGPIYPEMTQEQIFLILLCLIMTATLLLGMLGRQRRGPANVGYESLVMLATYVGGIAILAFAF